MPEYEPDPSGQTLGSTQPTAPYSDRSTGLVVFGILTILLGCLTALLALLMVAGQAMAASGALPNTSAGFASVLPALLIYVALAVALVWLGIGSIQARRWARALLLIFSWSWLFIGLIDMVILAFVIPTMLAHLPTAPGRPAIPASAMDVMLVTIFVIYAFIFIILPAIWTFFYNSRHVKATCEWRDPVTRWTDTCPLPVLGLCLWLLFSALIMLIMPFAANSVAPFFGMFITGILGTVFYLTLAALWVYSAWLLFHLDQRGWWLILIALCVFGVSAVITYSQHDIMDMYRLMGYPETQIQQIKQTGLLEGNSMSWMTGLSMLPLLGYLFFIKGYLPRKR